MAMASFPALLTLLSVSAVLVSCQIPDTVIQLDDSNFEHDTQASTGQTTGHWFVLFNTQLDPRNRKAVKDVWVQLAADEDKEVIFAELILDDDSNRHIARRFKDIQPPSAVLFRDQMMYVYPSSLTAQGSLDRLRGFVRGEYANVDPQYVPGSPAKFVPKPPVTETAGTKFKNSALGLLLLLSGIAIHAAVILRNQRIKAAEKAKQDANAEASLAPKSKDN